MLTRAADSLDEYATTLGWAQQKAADAIDMWAAAAAQTAESARRTREMERLAGPGDILPPAVDGGAELRTEARALLTYAREQVATAGTTAASSLRAAAGIAPPAPNPWNALGVLGAVMVEMQIQIHWNTIVDLVNGTASIGNAILHNPEALLAVLGGSAMIGGGAGLIGGGGAASLTGAGAAVGAPAAGAGFAAVGAGAAAVGAGATVIASGALGANRVELLERRGYDRGDGRDDYGQFANGQSSKPWVDKEKQGLDEVEEELGATINRDKVRASAEGTDQQRYFDGLYKNPDGTYTAVEVKSGSAVDKYLRNEGNQKAFDDAISPSSPARVRINGEWVDVVKVRVQVVE
jgi:hypothetical protein